LPPSTFPWLKTVKIAPALCAGPRWRSLQHSPRLELNFRGREEEREREGETGRDK